MKNAIETLTAYTVSGDLALRLSLTMDKPFHGRDSWDLRKAQSMGMLYDDVLEQALAETAERTPEAVVERYIAICTSFAS